MDAAIAWSQEANLPRAHELRQGVLGLEPALDDSEAHAPVDLTQMPCQLADRAPLRIGAVVVLSRWKGLEETDGSLGLAVPDSAEGFDLIQVWHGGPPGRIVVCRGLTGGAYSRQSLHARPDRVVEIAADLGAIQDGGRGVL